MSLDEKFNAAASSVKAMKNRPTDTELLELYALYKQASFGDCNTDKPGVADLKGKAKWEAWNGKKDILTFDNSYSWLAQKEIFCRAGVISPNNTLIQIAN